MITACTTLAVYTARGVVKLVFARVRSRATNWRARMCTRLAGLSTWGGMETEGIGSAGHRPCATDIPQFEYSRRAVVSMRSLPSEKKPPKVWHGARRRHTADTTTLEAGDAAVATLPGAAALPIRAGAPRWRRIHAPSARRSCACGRANAGMQGVLQPQSVQRPLRGEADASTIIISKKNRGDIAPDIS